MSSTDRVLWLKEEIDDLHRRWLFTSFYETLIVTLTIRPQQTQAFKFKKGKKLLPQLSAYHCSGVNVE